jgi:hypothetical protein
MSMTQSGNRYPGAEIQILMTSVIPNPNTFASR